MIKSLLLLSIAFFGIAISPASAQLSLGIRGGYSVGSFTYRAEAGRPLILADGITAPTAAFVIEYFGQKNAGIQMEIQYLTSGYTQQDTLMRVNQSELNYLKVPILSNFYFGNSGRFHIKLGPHFGYLLNARDTRRDYEGIGLLPTFSGPDDEPGRFMYGLTLGAGLSKLFGKSTLAGDFRFAYEFGRPDRQNRVFDTNSTHIEFTLSYLFQIKKGKWEN